MEWLHRTSWGTKLHKLAQNSGFDSYYDKVDKFVDQHKKSQKAVDDHLGTSRVLNTFFLEC